MSDLYCDIEKAKELILNKRCFDQFERIYPFTNEDIKDCFKNFDLKNKECLTVLSSSDQVFDMYLNGANNVDAFDINPLTKYYFYLKKAALLANISLKEYLNFFSRNCNPFNKETFIGISKYLEDDNYKFWSELYNNFNPSDIRKSGTLFSDDETYLYMLKQKIGYLNNFEYELLKTKIQNIKINFINSDIKNLSHKLTENYDFIYLSNIIQYVDNMYEYRYLNTIRNQIYKLNEYKDLIEKLGSNLNNKGTIVVGYIFDILHDYPQTAVFNRNARTKVFSSSSFDYVKIKNTDDACLVYTKK